MTRHLVSKMPSWTKYPQGRAAAKQKGSRDQIKWYAASQEHFLLSPPSAGEYFDPIGEFSFSL
jgi:hypothetical protein